MSAYSRRKGVRGEREAADLLSRVFPDCQRRDPSEGEGVSDTTGLAALLRANAADPACIKAARRGAEAAANGDGAHLNPYRRSAVAGGPRESLIRDCWEAGRVLWNEHVLEQLAIPEIMPQSGEQKKREGADARLRHDLAFHDRALMALRLLADTRTSFTSDDLHEALSDHNTVHPNSYGAVVMDAVRDGLIERVGFAKSARPKARGRMVAVYVRKVQS